ncbi:MAG: glycerophosphodiester phosphodiesterase, partial [Flavobacteriaceae bacterium]|nr:glycerophosphodiester phosphodiesterase [Flavobacteriaceae bacterium]
MKSTLKVGHRGAKGYISENTLPSIQKALDLNVDGIEIDV